MSKMLVNLFAGFVFLFQLDGKGIF